MAHCFGEKRCSNKNCLEVTQERLCLRCKDLQKKIKEKLPEDWSKEELRELNEYWPLDAEDLRLKQIRLEEERKAAEFNRKIKEQEALLELDRKKQEYQLDEDRQKLQLEHDHKLKLQEQEASRKLGSIEEELAQRRREHELSLQKSELEHKQKMQNEEEKVKLLQEERVRMQTEMDTKMRSQEMAYHKEAEELEKEIKKERQDLEREKMRDESDLTKKLALDQHEFRKKREEDKLRMEREMKESFLDRVTADFEITNTDGSKLTIRETEPGLVSHMTSGLFSETFPSSDGAFPPVDKPND